jgi:hypothetical protein
MEASNMDVDELMVRKLEALARLHEGAMQQAERYQNIVYGMFYAGFFGLWFGVGGKINFNFAMIAAVLMLLSIAVYAVWSVYNAQAMVAVHKLAAKKLMAYDDIDAMVVLENSSKVGETSENIYRYQPLVLYLTTSLAFLAVLALLSGLAHELFHRLQF